MSECAASVATPAQTDPEPTESTEPEQPAEPSAKTGVNPVFAIILVAAMGGILIFYFVKFKGKGSKRRGNPDIPFDDDDEEYETEEAPEEETGYAESEE